MATENLTVIRTVYLVLYHNLLTTSCALHCVYNITYRGAYKSLARSISQCILFDGKNISFDASLVMYINSTNIPPIMIINRIYSSKSSVAVACFLPGRAKDLSAPLH
jgi:hypothetical protein